MLARLPMTILSHHNSKRMISLYTSHRASKKANDAVYLQETKDSVCNDQPKLCHEVVCDTSIP